MDYLQERALAYFHAFRVGIAVNLRYFIQKEKRNKPSGDSLSYSCLVKAFLFSSGLSLIFSILPTSLSSSDPLSTVQSIDGISSRLAYHALGPIYYTLRKVFWISSPTEIASGWPLIKGIPLLRIVLSDRS